MIRELRAKHAGTTRRIAACAALGALAGLALAACVALLPGGAARDVARGLAHVPGFDLGLAASRDAAREVLRVAGREAASWPVDAGTEGVSVQLALFAATALLGAAAGLVLGTAWQSRGVARALAWCALAGALLAGPVVASLARPSDGAWASWWFDALGALPRTTALERENVAMGRVLARDTELHAGAVRDGRPGALLGTRREPGPTTFTAAGLRRLGVHLALLGAACALVGISARRARWPRLVPLALGLAVAAAQLAPLVPVEPRARVDARSAPWLLAAAVLVAAAVIGTARVLAFLRARRAARLEAARLVREAPVPHPESIPLWTPPGESAAPAPDAGAGPEGPAGNGAPPR